MIAILQQCWIVLLREIFGPAGSTRIKFVELGSQEFKASFGATRSGVTFSRRAQGQCLSICSEVPSHLHPKTGDGQSVPTCSPQCAGKMPMTILQIDTRSFWDLKHAAQPFWFFSSTWLWLWSKVNLAGKRCQSLEQREPPSSEHPSHYSPSFFHKIRHTPQWAVGGHATDFTRLNSTGCLPESISTTMVQTWESIRPSSWSQSVKRSPASSPWFSFFSW